MGGRRSARRRGALAAGAASLGLLAVSVAGTTGAPTQSPIGKTTVEQRIVPAGGDGGFRTLRLGAGEPYVVREGNLGKAKPGRRSRRRSLAYFGQISDFQLADEESPARVEFSDSYNSFFSAAWRPSEIVNPHIDDASVRQINAFADASPLPAGDGSRRAMDFTVGTGDLADSQQLNETRWVRKLFEGGRLDPGSGVSPVGYVNQATGAPHQLCAPFTALIDPAEAPRYTGVADYDDYDEGQSPRFYDPDDPRGAFAAFPAYPGLADEAQEPFVADGLDVPSYVVFGNHDALVQGNEDASRPLEDIATGCIKPLASSASPGDGEGFFASLTPAELLALSPGDRMLVPPDPARRFVSKLEFKEIFRRGSQPDGHGFDLIDDREEKASRGAAGYYGFTPVRGVRFIVLDTVSEGGQAGPSADGNVDDPQFRWLEGQLKRATTRNQLVVLFSHHGIRSMLGQPVPDEAAPPCNGPADGHGHDTNPGCDLDPRSSAPVHGEADMEELLLSYPHVIAWVAGHSHVNDVETFAAPAGKPGGFWMIRSAAEADWPQQSRLLEIFDNRDGTLSIFGTVVDHAARATAPGGGTQASQLTPSEMASVGRTLAANDPDGGIGSGEGDRADRNVELLVRDPRRGSAAGGRCANPVGGTRRPDRLRGTRGGDLIRGRAGADRIRGLAGADCLRGNSGRDRLRGGRGHDRLRGHAGRDVLIGGGGRDLLRGGRGTDRVFAKGGGRDRVRCGPGRRDVAVIGRGDRARGCERLRRVVDQPTETPSQ